MKKFKKIISLSLILICLLSGNCFANEGNTKNYLECDGNDVFMQKYYEATKNAKTSDELESKLKKLGFVKVGEEVSVKYFEEKKQILVDTGKRKVIKDGITSYYINNKKVDERSFSESIATLDTSTHNNPELYMKMTSYRGTQIDPYVKDKINLVYAFSWSGSTKQYDDIFGVSWNGDAFKIGVTASNGLTYVTGSETGRAFKFPSSINYGYVTVMLQSKDGYANDDNGSATSDYAHASGFPPNWSIGGSVGFNIAWFSGGFSASYSPQTTITKDVKDYMWSTSSVR